jgi:hypothetical protein
LASLDREVEGEGLMKLDLQKLDERIRKLQELRRLLADPETTAVLQELLSEDEPSSPAPAVLQTGPDAELLRMLKKMTTDETRGDEGLWGLRRK